MRGEKGEGGHREPFLCQEKRNDFVSFVSLSHGSLIGLFLPPFLEPFSYLETYFYALTANGAHGQLLG